MPPPTSGFLARAARAAVNHPWRVVAAWLVVLAAVVAIAPRFAGDGDVDFAMPGSSRRRPPTSSRSASPVDPARP